LDTDSSLGPKTLIVPKMTVTDMRSAPNGFLTTLPRRRQAELMDNPAIREDRHLHALRGLARINAVSGTAQALADPIRRLARSRGLAPVRVLDVACGAGDIARALHRHLRQAGIPAEIAGCDLSETAVRYAESRSSGLRFFRCDALRDPLPRDFDVLVCSQFLHHLSEQETVDLLRRMGEAARHLLQVSDLHRSRWSLAMAHAACRLLTRSAVVHFDGPASVRAAYTADEMRDLARTAGLAGATVKRHWAARFMLHWERRRGD
jgi:2-polyprenyl-3-methyl-5-hydroxy-6-metoxy-1,4-benzoquinol methylase